ncbi:toxin C-terminal domain-containing protein [Vibrio salinus]|uniref:toxin C-terminal domain-containing protein n=1 Tax=Vibrio salinus TaxID=2899784 RepID=UPI001E35096D|nr:toxin C-terminal domain-containing protein [Vibrio salinus]MCE0494161.1 toxin C-terminal domain-containing protein [Vibrio salinus]
MTGTETFYFGKTYERIVNAKTGETQHKHFVYADGKLIALNTQIRDKENKLKNKQVRYLHYDALNSVDMITDGYGNVVERRSYDTWGKQRKVLWRSSSASELIQEVITNRGYTGHEEIKEVGLIHMNGRVYDQELGRFLSADPHIQAPFLVNSFNRYSYVMNNPLKYVDPTGFSWVGGETCNVSTGEGCKTSKSTSSPDNGGKGNNDDDHQGKTAEKSKTTSNVSKEESVVDSDTKADSSGEDNEKESIKSELNKIERSIEKYDWDSFLDNMHFSLDVLGQTFGLGVGPDLLNAGIYAAEGKFGDALISGFAAVPFIGNGATSVRIGRRLEAIVAKGPRKLLEPVYKTAKEAKVAAEKLGFRKIKETTHGGQAVYQRGKNEFITRDLDGHNGGAWKMADSVKNLGKKETRDGTFDTNLNRIGD